MQVCSSDDVGILTGDEEDSAMPPTSAELEMDILFLIGLDGSEELCIMGWIGYAQILERLGLEDE